MGVSAIGSFSFIFTQGHKLDEEISTNEIVNLNELDSSAYKDTDPQVDIMLDDVAMITLTSGFGGVVKAVLTTHKNLISVCSAVNHPFQVTPKDRWVLSSPIVSSVAVWEIFMPLLSGGSVFIPEAGQLNSPALMIDALIENKVTVLHQPSLRFHALIREIQIREKLPSLSLKHLLLSGATLNFEQVKWWNENYKGTPLINVYVVAELSAVAAFKVLSNEALETDKNNVGTPIPALGFYIVDEDLHVVEQGMMGQLAVVGDTVAAGYLNRPDLTSQYFVENPYCEGQRMFLTGDLGRRLPNGEIILIGRKDSTPKIGGMTIEAAAIENSLVQAGASQAVVLRDTQKKPNPNFHWPI